MSIPKKILRIDKIFGSTSHDNLQANEFSCFHDTQKERQVLNIFKKHGWQIELDGKPDENNPWELGFHNYKDNGGILSNNAIAKRAGVLMPRKITKEEILSIDKPIAVKGVYSESGEDKYLIKSREQKLRLLIWMMMGHNVKELCQRSDMNKVIDSLKSNIMKGNFNSIWFMNFSIDDLFYFEEYVDTPSNYYTSYRIIVDAFANIHDALLIHSKNIKGVEVLNNSKYREYTDDPVEWAKPNHRLEIFLVHPDSPLFIASEKFVSNESQGGKKIFLNGQKISDPSSKKILEDHSIDPNNPQIPKILIKLAKAIGPVCKNMFPFVGVDFLQSKEGRFYFIEANAAPVLNIKNLGFPENSSWFQGTLLLLEKIAKIENTI